MHISWERYSATETNSIWAGPESLVDENTVLMRQRYSIALMKKLSPLDQIRTLDPLSMFAMHAIGLPGLDTPIHYCSRIKLSVLVCISDDMKFIFLQRTFFSIIPENGWNFTDINLVGDVFPQNRKTKTYDISSQGNGRKRYRMEF